MHNPLLDQSEFEAKAAPEVSSPLRLSDLVCSIALAALLALSVGLCGSGVTPWGNDAAGVLFLLLAVSYRGSRRAWWFFWAPGALLMLFAPILQWERRELLSVGAALRSSLLPGLAFIAGSLIAGVRDTLQISIEGSDELKHLQTRSTATRFELRRLAYQVKLMIDSMATAQFGGALESIEPADVVPKQLAATLPEPVSSEYRLVRTSDQSYRSMTTEAMSHVEIHEIIAEEVARLTERLKTLKLSARIRFKSSTESPVPLAVRGRPEILRTLVKDLLSVAADSLLKGEGILTVLLRPGLRSVSLTIEDNGRGLNETMLIKLEDKGLATRSPRLSVRELRSLAGAVGWSLAIQGRLGVGSRITLELARVDALASESGDSLRSAYARLSASPAPIKIQSDSNSPLC